MKARKTTTLLLPLALLAGSPAVAGEETYNTHCAVCHQVDGSGLPGAFPPLAGSDYLLEDPVRAVDGVLHGVSGPIRVSGELYNAVMPPMPYLSDEDVAAAVTYTLNAWGNDGGEVTPEQVATRRDEGGPVEGQDE